MRIIRPRQHVVYAIKAGRRLWTCAWCGTRDLWGDGWAAFGSWVKTEWVVCSDACRFAKAVAEDVSPEFIREPSP